LLGTCILYLAIYFGVHATRLPVQKLPDRF
jgi:hypothetical protein